MISGIVERGEARLRLTVKGPRVEHEIDCVVDTGYTGELTLPAILISKLELSWHGFGRSILADGSVCLFDVFEATAIWDRQYRPVLIDEADTEPLLGMRLMKEYELRVQVRAGGKVTLKRLTR